MFSVLEHQVAEGRDVYLSEANIMWFEVLGPKIREASYGFLIE